MWGYSAHIWIHFSEDHEGDKIAKKSTYGKDFYECNRFYIRESEAALRMMDASEITKVIGFEAEIVEWKGANNYAYPLRVKYMEEGINEGK